MKKISDYIIYGNYLIALGAGCFVWETYLLYKLPVNYLYILIGFMATLFTYNIDRLVVIKSMKNTESERHAWFVKYFGNMLFISIFSFIILMVSLFFLPWRSIFFLAHVGVLSLAYSIPVFAKGSKNLRGIKLLKIFLITYVWAASTVLFPLVGAGINILQRDIILLFIERALFIFAITLPFDIRDYKSDVAHKVVTIPGIIGIKQTRVLAFICLSVFFLINLYHYNFHSGILWAKLLSGLSTFGIITYAQEDRHEYYFTGLIDGTIIIQFLLVLGLCNFSF